MANKSIADRLLSAFKGMEFTLKQAYAKCTGVNNESVRARIYENLGIKFLRVRKGVYVAKDQDCVLIEGDGRDLSILEDKSIDCIITDHPWLDKKANKGGSRNFAQYDCFEYTPADFIEKARVLKQGSFLCEIIPAESATNYEYLYRLKKMAEAAGFQYYSKVPWKKGTFVSNTGRKAKNTEDCLIFSLGPARKLRPDKQRGLDANGNPTRFMSGAAGMLPTEFDYQQVSKKDRIAQSEKPVELFETLIGYLTKLEEIVLDQFAGSGVCGEAAINTGRGCVLFEKVHELCDKICDRLGLTAPVMQTVQ